MFDGLKRLQLQKRGLSCGRTRRTTGDSEVLELLRYNGWIKLLAFVTAWGALVLLASYRSTPGAVFEGEFIKVVGVITAVFGVAVVQFFANHPNSFRRNSRGRVDIWADAAAGGGGEVVDRSRDGEWLVGEFAFLLMPYGFGAMALSVLLGRAQGILVAVFGTLWSCLVVPEAQVFPFLVTSLVCGFVAVYVTNQVRRRSRLVRAGLFLGVTGLLLTAVLGFIEVPDAEQLTKADWQAIGVQVLAVLAVGAFTATLVSGMLPVLESLFHVTTDVSWIELADLNHPLLRKMTIEAPGTYHHSLVVANLAEAAAEAVGANATMCRVCSYFHDIGKLAKPEYFIENIPDGENPHDDLTPTMSALVISAHVKEGVDLAIKHKLNSEIIDVIEQHHGTSLIYYFYRRAKDQQGARQREAEEGHGSEEDVPEVDEKSFRYGGPKPQTRESAIISLADAVESASRSLAKPTPPRILQMIDDIVSSRLKDDQLDECDLNFSELAAVKKSFFDDVEEYVAQACLVSGGG